VNVTHMHTQELTCSAHIFNKVLQCVAVCCSVSQCVTVCHSVSQRIAVWRRVVQCGAVCRSVAQCGAVCCSALQRIAETLSCNTQPPYYLMSKETHIFMKRDVYTYKKRPMHMLIDTCLQCTHCHQAHPQQTPHLLPHVQRDPYIHEKRHIYI